MLKQSYHTNKQLENTKKYKGIIGIQGRLYVECEVQSITKGVVKTSIEIGESSGNMKYFDNHYMRALENAIYKHQHRFSWEVTNPRVIFIYDYWIKYFNDDVKVKRVRTQEFKVITTKPYTRIVKKTKKIKVKGYTRSNGNKVKGYTREVVKYSEVLVKGYERKIPKGKGSYNSVVTFKGDRVMTSSYKRRSIKHLNNELININTAKNKASFIDRV